MRTIIFLIFFFLNFNVFADVDKIAISEFKSYLSSLKSVAIDFHQSDERGSNAEGTLIIVKPSKFACNYYAPYPLSIVGNKSYISVYDFDLEQLSRIKAEDNMFDFLLTSKVDIENNFHINQAVKTTEKIDVELYHKESDRTTKVVVGQNPLRLLSIVTSESDGNIIKLMIDKITNIRDVDNSLFAIKNPEVFGKPNRRNKSDLQKLYKCD